MPTRFLSPSVKLLRAMKGVMMRARLQVSASSAAGRHAACSSAFRCDTRRLSSLSSLSDITSRVLREGNEQLGGAIPGPSLPALEALTAALPPQPVSIQMVKGAVGNRSLSNRLVQANFIRRELIARRAYILALMHMMPEPLAGRPAVGQLGGIYWERLRELLAMPVLETDEDEREFYVRQKEVNERIIDVSNAEEEQMCVSALDAMQRERGSDWWATHPEDRLAVDRHMDAIFLARIGLRCVCHCPSRLFECLLLLHCGFAAAAAAAAEAAEAAAAAATIAAPAAARLAALLLVGDADVMHRCAYLPPPPVLLEHYIASATTREGFSGIVENRCSPFALCEEVAAETQALLRQEHKTEEVPHIEVVKVNDTQTFTFVPSHLRLVVGTLLKNSSVATLRSVTSAVHGERRRTPTFIPSPPHPPPLLGTPTGNTTARSVRVCSMQAPQSPPSVASWP